MNRYALLTLALALLLALAGCNGAIDGNPTDTPASVPPDEAGYPPGVDAAEVYSTEQLVTAHYEVLIGTSYTREENRTSRYANGTVRSHYRRIVRATGLEGDFRAVTTYAPPQEQPIPVSDVASPTRSEQYVEGDRVYYRVSNETVTQHGSIPRPNGDRTQRLAFYLQSFDLQVANHTEQGDTTATVLESTNLTDPFFLIRAEHLQSEPEIRNGNFHAVVDSSGLVREYEIRYTMVFAGGRDSADVQPVTVRTNVTHTDLGDTTVSRPAWYGQAAKIN